MSRFFTVAFCCLGWLLTWPALATQLIQPAQPTLEFVENKGQWPGPTRYTAALANGGQLFAEPGGLRLALLADGALDHAAHAAHADAGHPTAPEQPLRGHAFDLRWVQPSPTAELSARILTPEHRNYLRGNDPKHWARDVRSYRELRYAELWPGIDARLYENESQQLEYDLELAPGADPAAINLRHDGTTATLDAAGNLQLATTVGVVQELAPRAWQLDAAGQRRAVACRYRLSAAGVVGFVLGRYDHARPLTIDPTLVFATYTGSTANNWGFTATYDAQGNLYSGGIAFSLGYPASPGAFQTTFGGSVDMAFIKYRVTQRGAAARVWATYLGGSLPDYPHSLVVNAQGELLVLGTTGSSNFPTTAGAVQPTFAGGTPITPFTSTYTNGSDLVVSRLSADGSTLQASTYLGGSQNDGLVINDGPATITLAYNYGDNFRGDLLVDAAGGVYVASVTTSTNFPLGTGSSFQRTYQGGVSDAVVVKLDAALGVVQWGGYLGGTGTDAAYSLQQTASGEVYVAGGTTSPALPATTGALNATARGLTDGFVARLAAGGGSVVRTTYLGTAAYDQAYFLQLGGDGGVYVLGQTQGAYPTTPGLYTNAGGSQFIHKLAPDLGSTLLATVFGSSNRAINISPSAFLVDQCDRVYVSGWGGLAGTGSTTGLPVTSNALQTTTDGSDFYLAQFNTGLSSLGYATFYGGNGIQEHVDGGTSRFDPRGVVYQAVCSCRSSTGFPILAGANYYSTTNGSPNSCNNAAFVLDFQASLAAVSPPLTVCAGSTQPLAGTPAGGTWAGPGVSGSPAAGYVFTAPGAGTYSLTYTFSTGTCNSTAAQQVTVVGPPATPAIALSLQGSYCLGDGDTVPVVPLTGTPAGGTFTGTGVQTGAGGSQIFDPNQVTGSSATVTYTYTYGNNCVVQVSREVTIYRPAAGPDRLLCVDAAPLPLLPASSVPGGVWSGPGVSGSAAAGFVFTPSPALLGVNVLTYSVPGSATFCGSTRRITVVPPDPLVLTPLPPSLCRTDNTRYPLAATPADGAWSGPGVGGAAGAYHFTPSVAGAGTFTLTYSRGPLGGRCPITQTLQVTVDAPAVAVVPADTLLCPGTQPRLALRGSPAGGTWAGPGVSGSPATGFFFTPPPTWSGSSTLTYTVGPASCATTATRRIGVAPVPTWQPAAAPVGCPGDQQLPLALRFSDAAGNAATRWDFGDGSPVQIGAVVTHVYQQVGTFQPRASLPYNSGRCELSAPLAAVKVVNQPIPNIIIPGSPTLNRTFQLPPTGCEPRLQLFSRWGQRVYETDAYHNDWDAAGHAAGLYYYLVTYPDGHSIKGWLEVVK